MQPEPFSNSTPAGASPQPFSSSMATVGPLQNPPIAAPIGAPPNSVAPSATGVPADASSAPLADEQMASLIKAHSKGANWFFWIVALSVINIFLVGFNSEKVLAIGTNATLFMDYIMKDEIPKNASIAGTLRLVEIVFDVFVLGFYAFCGIMAVRGKVWAFYLGMTFFALDTLLSVLGADIIGGLIHAWALFTMWMGARSLKQIHAIHRAAQAPPTPWAI